MFDAANVLVHRRPVLSALGHHRVGVGRVAIAHEVPRRIHKRVHRVGLATRGLAAHGARHTRVETFVLVQRIARTIGDAVLRQHHGQVFFRHRHCAVFVAMNDWDGCAPVALAADAPVAQTPCGFLLAQAFGCEQFGNFVDGSFLVQAIQFARVDADAALLVAVPLLPRLVTEGLVFDRHHLFDRQVVFQSEREVTLVVRRHTHHSAIAVRHEHVIAHPHFDLRARQRVRDKQARGHALFLLRGQLGFGSATALAFFEEGSQDGVACRGVQREWMLGGHRTKRHTHDGVGACGKHIHLALLTGR